MPSKLIIRLFAVLLSAAWLAVPVAAQQPATIPEEVQTAGSEAARSADPPSQQPTETFSLPTAAADKPQVPAEVSTETPLAASSDSAGHAGTPDTHTQTDVVSMAFVFMLATFIGIGVIRRVSRLLHTPLMSLTNAISAISVIGAIIVAGGEHYPTSIRVMGAVALFASMTNIISGFLITDRMLKMFKTNRGGKA